MSNPEEKEQSQQADRRLQTGQSQEKISLWLIMRKRWPWLRIIYWGLVLMGIYALMTGPITFKKFLLAVIIVELYKFIDKLIIKWLLKRRVTRNDKK